MCVAVSSRFFYLYHTWAIIFHLLRFSQQPQLRWRLYVFMHSATTGRVHLFTPGWMFAVYLPSAATWTLNPSLTHIRVMFIFANVISPTLRPAFRLWALGCSNFCGNCRKLQRDDILYFLCSLQPGFIDTILYPAVVHCTVHQSCKRIQNQIEAIVTLLGWLWHDKRQYLLCS